MGTSGFILKKRENIEIYQLIHEVKAAADRAGLLSPIDPEIQEWAGEVYAMGSIANTFEEIPGAEAMPIYIHSADDEKYDDQYDWLVEGGRLNNAVFFDFVGNCERILLDFLYEYLKSNPEDYFLCEGDWYYTFDDIARIKERGFDPMWCYIDPRLEEDALRRMEEENRNVERSGFILKERESAGIYQMIHEVEEAADRAELQYSIGFEFHDSRNGGVSVEGNIAKTFEEISGADDVKKEDTAISICSAEQNDDLYDWLIKGSDLVDVITFDRVGHRERLLLDFLYEYLQRNPEDYFWCRGYDWYYTFDDIARIKQKEFDPLWCYKDPRLKEYPHE